MENSIWKVFRGTNSPKKKKINFQARREKKKKTPKILGGLQKIPKIN